MVLVADGGADLQQAGPVGRRPWLLGGGLFLLGPGDDLESELLQDAVDQLAPVEGGHDELLLGVLHRVDVQHVAQEVVERAGGPAFESGGRGDLVGRRGHWQAGQVAIEASEAVALPGGDRVHAAAENGVGRGRKAGRRPGQ